MKLYTNHTINYMYIYELYTYIKLNVFLQSKNKIQSSNRLSNRHKTFSFNIKN